MRSRLFALKEVYTKREIFLFLLVFVLLLVAVFPRWTFEEMFRKDPAAKIPLRIKYLEALSKVSDNLLFKEALVESYIQAGDYKKALAYLEELERLYPEDTEIKKLRYLLIKRFYFEEKDPLKKGEYLKQSHEILFEMASVSQDVKSLEFLYKEALSMNAPSVAFLASYKLALTTKDRRWIKESISLAFALGKYKEALKLLPLIEGEDKESVYLRYRLYIALKDY